jgi:hypothetical protein
MVISSPADEFHLETSSRISGNRLGPFDFTEYCVISKRMWRRLIRADRLTERAKAKGSLENK